MSGTWTNDPGWREYVQNVKDDLIPKLGGSAYVMSFVPEDNEPDVKFAVELGFSIMMDKPIFFVIHPGVPVPEKLRRVADGFIDWTDDPQVMSKRIQRLMRRLEKS